MKSSRFQHLVDQHFSGAASREEMQELGQHLVDDDAARTEFWRAAEFAHLLVVAMESQDELSQLAWQAANSTDAESTDHTLSEPSGATDTQPEIRRPLVERVLKHDIRISVAAAALVTVAVLVWSAVTYLPDVATPVNPPVKAEWVALLNDRHNVHWLDDTGPAPNRPRLFPGQRLAIASGLLDIRYRTGARVVIEGPAEFVVGGEDARAESGDSANSGFLKFGKLIARVETETAQGFTITTPTTKVEDLGTEFAVDVARDGNTNLHVFEGEVRLGGSRDVPARVVHAGSSYRVAEDTEGHVAAAVVRTLRRRFARVRAAQRANDLATEFPADVVKSAQWDTFVLEQSPKQNFATATELLVKREDPGGHHNREIWLGFDLADVDRERLIDAELVLTTTPGVKVPGGIPPVWEFSLLGVSTDKAKPIHAAGLTWITSRGAKTQSIAPLRSTSATPLGSEVRVGGEKLVEWLRDGKRSTVVLVIRRITPSRSFVNGFASSEQGDSGPTLRLRYRDTAESHSKHVKTATGQVRKEDQ